MKTPAAVLDWLIDKVEAMPWSSVREPRKVTHEWRRQTGGRTMSAGLTATIAFQYALHCPGGAMNPFVQASLWQMTALWNSRKAGVGQPKPEVWSVRKRTSRRLPGSAETATRCPMG